MNERTGQPFGFWEILRFCKKKKKLNTKKKPIWINEDLFLVQCGIRFPPALRKGQGEK